MGLYVRVAEKFVACNYMQPQSGHVKTTWMPALYVAAVTTVSVTKGIAADCIAQRGKLSY